MDPFLPPRSQKPSSGGTKRLFWETQFLCAILSDRIGSKPIRDGLLRAASGTTPSSKSSSSPAKKLLLALGATTWLSDADTSDTRMKAPGPGRRHCREIEGYPPSGFIGGWEVSFVCSFPGTPCPKPIPMISASLLLLSLSFSLSLSLPPLGAALLLKSSQQPGRSLKLTQHLVGGVDLWRGGFSWGFSIYREEPRVQPPKPPILGGDKKDTSTHTCLTRAHWSFQSNPPPPNHP